MTIHRQLPPPEKSALTLGFMRLTDSAPLVLAREAGLFERYGLEVTLSREVSWANLRDKLVAGSLDAAQLLAPLPMMTAYGVGGPRARLLTGLSLGLNGHAITLSRPLWEKLGGEGADALAMARALGAGLKDSAGAELPTLATVHLFSMHTLQLRLWLRAGGLDPERDVRIIVLPPEQMCDSLARGVIDGFCVGEPWNTVSVQQGIGAIVASGYEIWNNAPEKVLGVSEAWHSLRPATHLRLRLALMEACLQLREPETRESVAEMLAKPEYLDLPVNRILPSLTGRVSRLKNGEAMVVPDFHVFGRYHAGFPWRSQAAWMARESGTMLGKVIAGEQLENLVQQACRPDLYREAARHLELPAPTRDNRPENAHDEPWELEPGIVLGPDRIIS